MKILKLLKVLTILNFINFIQMLPNIIFAQIVEYTHHNPRSNPAMTGFNLGCLDNFDTFQFNDVEVNDGANHPLDKKVNVS